MRGNVLPKIGEGFVSPAKSQQEQSSVVPSILQVGTQLQRGIVLRNRFIELPKILMAERRCIQQARLSWYPV